MYIVNWKSLHYTVFHSPYWMLLNVLLATLQYHAVSIQQCTVVQYSMETHCILYPLPYTLCLLYCTVQWHNTQWKHTAYFTHCRTHCVFYTAQYSGTILNGNTLHTLLNGNTAYFTHCHTHCVFYTVSSILHSTERSELYSVESHHRIQVVFRCLYYS